MAFLPISARRSTGYGRPPPSVGLWTRTGQIVGHGLLSILDHRVPPGFAPPPHLHHHTKDADGIADVPAEAQPLTLCSVTTISLTNHRHEPRAAYMTDGVPSPWLSVETLSAA